MERQTRNPGLFCVGLTLVGLTASSCTQAPANDRNVRLEMRRVIQSARDKVYPALVHIYLVTSQYSGGKEVKGRAVGSGTIISPEGYVLTNHHVTDRGRRFRCTLSDKREFPAEMVGEDPLTDLAVLKLDLSGLEDIDTPLPVASFGDSSTLQIGDTVLAMGSPYALSRAVTKGIVSNTERVFAGGLGRDDDMRLGRWQRTGLFTIWIQHDAMINPGNSGGPLVNLTGEIIGVNELGGSGMGFAIPANLARQVADTLIESGQVVRSQIGVSFKSLKKTGLTEGVIVNSVVTESPAAQAGLEPGDVILKIDGTAVTVRFAEEIPPLLKRIADAKVGTKIDLVYTRKDHTKTATATVTTAKLEKDRGDQVALRAWGFTAMQITPIIMREFRLDSQTGVLVTGVRPGGTAALAKPALIGGDIITSLDGQAVADLDDFVKRYKSIMDTDPLPEYILVAFNRKRKNFLTLVKSKPHDEEPPPPELRKAWIGIAVQPVLKDLAKRLDIKKHAGFRITRIYPRTVAASADLKVGDVITHLNDDRLRPRRIEDVGVFYRAVKQLEIDDEAKLTIVRDRAVQETSLRLEPSKIRPDEAKRNRNRDFEISVREITFFDRVDNRWDEDVAGVIVETAESAGWAGLGGVRRSDLIQKIDDTEIADVDTFKQVLETLTKQKPKRIVFFVLRGARTRFQYVEPQWTPEYKKKEKAEKETQGDHKS